jgi:hypothetical protein
MAKARRTRKSIGFRPFGNDIMIMDPAMVHHDEAVDKPLASSACASRRNSRECPPRLTCPANPKLPPGSNSGAARRGH